MSCVRKAFAEVFGKSGERRRCCRRFPGRRGRGLPMACCTVPSAPAAPHAGPPGRLAWPPSCLPASLPAARELGMHMVYDVAHNIAKEEEHELDGTQ